MSTERRPARGLEGRFVVDGPLEIRRPSEPYVPESDEELNARYPDRAQLLERFKPFT